MLIQLVSNRSRLISFDMSKTVLQLVSNMVMETMFQISTASKVCKYGVFSDPYFPVFSPNTGKYGPEKTPYLDTFHTVFSIKILLITVIIIFLCNRNIKHTFFESCHLKWFHFPYTQK